jgi:hypothetical protein
MGLQLVGSERWLAVALCILLVLLVHILALMMASTQDPEQLSRELLSDADCVMCNEVRRRCSVLVLSLSLLPASEQLTPPPTLEDTRLLLDCSRNGVKKALMRTLCESGSSVAAREAGNLLLRSVCESGAGFKPCSIFMNQYREEILENLVRGLVDWSTRPGGRSVAMKSDRPLDGLPYMCWPVCEARLKAVDRWALLVVTWAAGPEVQRMAAFVRDTWGTLFVLCGMGGMLFAALHLKALQRAHGVKIHLVMSKSQRQLFISELLQYQKEHHHHLDGPAASGPLGSRQQQQPVTGVHKRAAPGGAGSKARLRR